MGIKKEFNIIRPSDSLVTFKNPQSPYSESYRVLRTNLGFSSIVKSFKTVLVTSASAQEGKSTVASNLAIVCAQAGYKVILVDCDLRKPTQHKLFDVPNDNGFTNCIFSKDDHGKAVRTLNLINLSVLTSGPIPPNPAEILNSERTLLLWTDLKNKYDYIFIDSPPVLSVADASILAAQSDAVLLVVKSGYTRIEHAKQVMNQLTQANARLIGVVLNQVEDKDNYYYKY